MNKKGVINYQKSTYKSQNDGDIPFSPTNIKKCKGHKRALINVYLAYLWKGGHVHFELVVQVW
jgi:hypothetical protein